METHFQQELNRLKSEILRMAGLVERAIRKAIESLIQRDTPLAGKTIQPYARINEAESFCFFYPLPRFRSHAG